MCTPGATRSCSESADGSPIHWPGGAPQGECKYGRQTCVESHGAASWGPCEGSVAPAARDCTSSRDNDCDGKPDDTHDMTCQCQPSDPTSCTGSSNCPGTRTCDLTKSHSSWSTCQAPSHCDCTDGATQPCNVGMCRGTQSCSGGQWGACESGGSALPQDCECAGGTQSCGTTACPATQSCGSDFTWGACPVPPDCQCMPGDTRSCGSDPDPGIGLDSPCGEETCSSSYSWNRSGCTAKLELYQDADGDGEGNQFVRQLHCPGAGWTPDDSDCDDSNPSLRTFNYDGQAAPSSCSKDFNDGWPDDTAFWSCSRPSDYDTFSGFAGMNYTFNFWVSQSGNVARDSTLAAEVCCSNDTVNPAGNCVDILASDFEAGTHFSLTCPGNPSIVYIKEQNAGGGCCGGYTRNINAETFTDYTGCDP